MGRLSNVAKLPASVVEQLDAKLRESWYGDLEANRSWLEEKGHKISLSALHRYSVALRSVDARQGKTRALFRPDVHKKLREGQRDALLIELGRLRLREQELLTQLAEMANDSEMGPEAEVCEG